MGLLPPQLRALPQGPARGQAEATRTRLRQTPVRGNSLLAELAAEQKALRPLSQKKAGNVNFGKIGQALMGDAGLGRVMDRWSRPGGNGALALLSLPYETAKEAYQQVLRPGAKSTYKLGSGQGKISDVANVAELYPGFKGDNSILKSQIDIAKVHAEMQPGRADLRNAQQYVGEARKFAGDMRSKLIAHQSTKLRAPFTEEELYPQIALAKAGNRQNLERQMMQPGAMDKLHLAINQFRQVAAPLSEKETRPVPLQIRNAQERAAILSAYIQQRRSQKVLGRPTLRHGWDPGGPEQLIQFLGGKGKLATNPGSETAVDPQRWSQHPINEHGVPIEAFAHPPAIQDFVPGQIYLDWMHTMQQDAQMSAGEAHAMLQNWINNVWEAHRGAAEANSRIRDSLFSDQLKPGMVRQPFMIPGPLQAKLKDFIDQQKRYGRG